MKANKEIFTHIYADRETMQANSWNEAVLLLINYDSSDYLYTSFISADRQTINHMDMRSAALDYMGEMISDREHDSYIRSIYNSDKGVMHG